jgi:hypothetical protein
MMRPNVDAAAISIGFELEDGVANPSLPQVFCPQQYAFPADDNPHAWLFNPRLSARISMLPNSIG